MTENRFIRRIWSVLVCFVLITAMTLTSTACQNKKTETVTDNQTTVTTPDPDEGKIAYTLLVIDKDGAETKFDLKTDEKTVGAALLKEGLIEGEDSQYGLYVKKVNGILADYNVDQTYWAFYINGEYAMTGVDSTDIVAGSTYTLKVEK